MAVEFHDFSVKCKGIIGDKALQWLEESSSELEAQAKRNQTRVDTGLTKNSWTHKVDVADMIATVGNPYENAVWEEFGTGEFALNGDGRKGGWLYEDAKGEVHFTRGKTPLRALHKAFTSSKAKIQARAEQVFKGL